MLGLYFSLSLQSVDHHLRKNLSSPKSIEYREQRAVLRTTPTETINAVLNLLSIDIIRLHNAVYYISFTDFKTYSKIVISYKVLWDRIIPASEDSIHFYSDGSQLDNRVDDGVYSQNLGSSKSFHLTDRYSVFKRK